MKIKFFLIYKMIGAGDSTPKGDEKKEEDKEITKEDKELTKKIDNYDSNMLNYLARLYHVINDENLDFSKIKNAVDALQQFNSRQEYNYLNNLLYPERCKNVKIPTPIPIPSCSFQLHNCVTLTTNASGNLGVWFNPFFLANNNILTNQINIGNVSVEGVTNAAGGNLNYLSTLWVNNDDSLTGSLPNNKWKPVNIGQVLPPVYDQFRLVSASIVIKYIGRLDITSGVIGGAIIFDEDKNIGGEMYVETFTNMEVGTFTTTDANLSKYGNFDLAMDSFYHQENLCLEGIRELYFPLDNSYEEYVKVIDNSNIDINVGVTGGDITSFNITGQQDYYKSGFNWLIYALGAPSKSACFKLDIYCNYECLPNASFLNYLPLSMNAMGVSSEEKKHANLIVQQKPVMKLSEVDTAKLNVMPSVWEKLKNKFGGKLPGLGKLLKMGLVSYIPGMKGGLSLAGNMLEMASNSNYGNMMLD